MKSMYYQSHKISVRSLATMAFVTLVLVAVVQTWPFSLDTSTESAMLAATTKTAQAYDAIHHHRRNLGHRFLSDHDPGRTGMVGPSMSRVTSLPGHLISKQTSVNPQFAAVIMRLLLDAGVRPGDRIAIGCTGSFPAMNVAAYSAAESLRLRTSVVSSVASSQFGANHPEMMWPDIETLLNREGILSTRSLAASRGGFRDNAVGMTDDTREVLDLAIERNGLPPMHCNSIDESIDTRMKLYRESSDGEPFAAYVNIGGGSASVGGTKGNLSLGSGVLFPPSRQQRWWDRVSSQPDQEPIDCVANRFLAADVPVVNLIDIVSLARRFNLPVGPVWTSDASALDSKVCGAYPVSELSIPPAVRKTTAYRRVAAVFAIVAILGCVTALARPPKWWTRFSRHRLPSFSGTTEPTWMV